jgi:hypothetical protein
MTFDRFSIDPSYTQYTLRGIMSILPCYRRIRYSMQQKHSSVFKLYFNALILLRTQLHTTIIVIVNISDVCIPTCLYLCLQRSQTVDDKYLEGLIRACRDIINGANESLNVAACCLDRKLLADKDILLKLAQSLMSNRALTTYIVGSPVLLDKATICFEQLAIWARSQLLQRKIIYSLLSRVCVRSRFCPHQWWPYRSGGARGSTDLRRPTVG